MGQNRSKENIVFHKHILFIFNKKIIKKWVDSIKRYESCWWLHCIWLPSGFHGYVKHTSKSGGQELVEILHDVFTKEVYEDGYTLDPETGKSLCGLFCWIKTLKK